MFKLCGTVWVQCVVFLACPVDPCLTMTIGAHGCIVCLCYPHCGQKDTPVDCLEVLIQNPETASRSHCSRSGLVVFWSRGCDPEFFRTLLHLKLVGGLEHVFPYIGNNHPNWLIFCSEGLKPPTRWNRLIDIKHAFVCCVGGSLAECTLPDVTPPRHFDARER